MLRAVSGWSYILQKQLSSVLTDSLLVHAVLKKDNWRDCQDWTRKIKIQSRRVKGFLTILWMPSLYGVDGLKKQTVLLTKEQS